MVDIGNFFYIEKIDKKKENNRKNTNYKELLGQLLGENIIDLVEYKFMDKYNESGNLYQAEMIKRILNKVVDSKFKESDKYRFLQICDKLFSHVLNFEENQYQKTPRKDLEKLFLETSKIKYTVDQKKAICELFTFLVDESRCFGLYGYAGSGKTTLIIEFLGYLLENNFINKIAFTAPTNKAVNIMKSKFRNKMKVISQQLKIKDEDFDEQIECLKDHKKFVNFITIHRLLNYQNSYDIDGSRKFIKTTKGTLDQYEIVIIDECSMIPQNIIRDIFKEMREQQNKKFKVIFIGDPAQLPPVSEKMSIVFEGFSFKTSTMEQIVRTKDNRMMYLCNDVRKWIYSDEFPKIKKYLGDVIFTYKYLGGSKLDSKWLQVFINQLESKKKEDNNNIILTWTNKQCNAYNQFVRQHIFGKKDLDRFEMGEIIILTDFYKFDESGEENVFYTSEQLKVMDIEEDKKMFDSVCIDTSKLKRMKNYVIVQNLLKKYEAKINKLAGNTYRVWKLHNNKLADVIIPDKIAKAYTINVIHESEEHKLEKDKKTFASLIDQLRNEYLKSFKNEISRIDKHIITPLWKQWNRNLVNPFAEVNYGYSTTVHKSQGSTYYNVFVDVHDILENNNQEEMKRCLYTALTRTSNQLHMII